ncbi:MULTISPECIES: permease [unclassified Brevundimonas]|uniref:permease n=1 Tax=unclassified Brevundimonas TaxID=2622653 RepID=UPI003F92F6CF
MIEHPLTPLVLALLGFCIVTEVGRELSFKGAANGAEQAPRYVIGLSLHPLLWLGLVFWAVEVVAWVLVLEKAPLTIAYPIMTLTYAAVPLAGAMILHEPLTRKQMAGAGLVALGVICVGLSGLG